MVLATSKTTRPVFQSARKLRYFTILSHYDNALKLRCDYPLFDPRDMALSSHSCGSLVLEQSNASTFCVNWLGYKQSLYTMHDL